MSAKDTISKLEAMLTRVRTRGAEPRARSVIATMVAAAPAPTARPMGGDDDDELGTKATLPPPAERVEEVVRVPHAPAIGEVGEPTVVDERLESRSRLIAAEPAAAPAAEPTLEELAASQEEFAARASQEEVAEEVIERPPASSRRPVAMPEEQAKAIEEAAFGEEVPPPRHTPPPESGRLPAAPVVEFDPDITGVREANTFTGASPAPVDAELAEQTRPDQFAAVAEVARREPPPPVSAMQPHVTRAEIEPSGEVADYVNAPKAPDARSFAELLEGALDL